ncbi:hypothetical protein NE237_016211 [Protea cynaroides]|uniref:Uncharacterized protein n=1 Tax=Protea cynaroides TaxID=273540 RepID=A0A9Q0QRT6_9MAGN|nr:hypothetical protein NE237_016211 [Protea cynaroides]
MVIDIPKQTYGQMIISSLSNNRAALIYCYDHSSSASPITHKYALLELQILDLSRQNLSDEFLLELADLPNLQHIALGENASSGNVLEGFGSLYSLTYLNLTSNAFSGEIPATYGFLRSLTILSLSSNLFSSSIPSERSAKFTRPIHGEYAEKDAAETSTQTYERRKKMKSSFI